MFVFLRKTNKRYVVELQYSFVELILVCFKIKFLSGLLLIFCCIISILLLASCF